MLNARLVFVTSPRSTRWLVLAQHCTNLWTTMVIIFTCHVCLTIFQQRMSGCSLPSYTINFMVVILWWTAMKWWWSFAKREPWSQFLLTGMPQTCPLCTIFLCPRRSRGSMHLSSSLLFMQLGFMQRLSTLPMCQLTKICQWCRGNRIPFPASHVLAVWITRTCRCPRESYSFGIGNLALGCNFYKQWCDIKSLRTHLADCSVIHPS